MINSNKVIKQLPEMLSGENLINKMQVLPKYDRKFRENGSVTERLIKLSDLYNIYIPSQMSIEIYNKLYLGIVRSLQKKGETLTIKQYNSTYKTIQNIKNKIGDQNYNGIMGGADSFTIIGTSGIGKSSTISRALNLIRANYMIEIEKPYTRILPCLIVQCPFDSSVKGLLVEILRKVDEQLGTSYFKSATIGNRTTTDMLIGSVSQICLNHIGLLVVDEIQNVVNSRNGKNLIGSLTQIINNSGISICMVGTPESERFFEQAMQLARRSIGLKYEELNYDSQFKNICTILFSYQYTKKYSEISDQIIESLYQYSGGNISVIISLIHDAQEISLMNGREILDLISLEEAYKKRLSMLCNYIKPEIKKQYIKYNKNNFSKNISQKKKEINSIVTIKDIVLTAKKENVNIIKELSKYIIVEVI